MPVRLPNKTAIMDDDEMLFVARMASGVVTGIASSRLVAARKRRRRTIWVKPLFQRHSEKSEYGAYNLLLMVNTYTAKMHHLHFKIYKKIPGGHSSLPNNWCPSHV